MSGIWAWMFCHAKLGTEGMRALAFLIWKLVRFSTNSPEVTLNAGHSTGAGLARAALGLGTGGGT